MLGDMASWSVIAIDKFCESCAPEPNGELAADALL
jgi:hypothetical protein